MLRPSIKDKEVLKYVEYLEKRVAVISANPAFEASYKALYNFVMEASKAIGEADLNSKTIQDKEDKFIDRVLKFADKIDEYNDKLEKMEKRLNPELVKEIKAEAGSVLEDVLRERIQDE